MAALANNISLLTPQTAADVWARAALVRAWRDRVWPSLPQRRAEPPAAPPLPPVPAALPLPARSDAEPGRITVRLVLDVTAKHFGLPIDHLLTDMRTQPLCRRRQIAMYVAHRTTGRSLVFIGKKMAGRDHTTILHGVRTVQARIEAGDVETIAAVNAIVAQLTGGAHG